LKYQILKDYNRRNKLFILIKYLEKEEEDEDDED
jgi:hypothetical protein